MRIDKKIINTFIVMLLSGITMNMFAENRFYIEDFSIEPEETKEVGIILDNDVDFAAFQADVILPEGLSFADMRTAAEISKGKQAYYFTLTERKDDHSISSAEIGGDPQSRRIISSSGNNWIFYSAADVGTAVLVNFKVKASSDFAGTAVIQLDNIIFTQADETQYNLVTTTAVVSLPTTKVESVSLNTSTLTLEPEESASLTATVLPESATNKSLNWETSNSGVATVDSNGLVKAIADGSATITVSATDGSGCRATCEVTVKKRVNRFYIEDFSIEAGETKEVGIILDNDVDFAAFQADVILPEGLAFADMRTAAEISKGKQAYYFTLTERKDDHSISSAEIGGDPQSRRIVSSSNNNWTFYSATDVGTAVLVNFKIKAASNFFGTAVIQLDNIIFTQADETQYDLESTEATVTGPEWEAPTGVELTVTSALHGSMVFIVENGKTQSLKLLPDDGYMLHSLTLNGVDVKGSIIENYYTTPALTEAATLNVVFEIVTGVTEVIASDRVRVTAANGYIKVDGTVAGEQVHLYTSNGVLVNSAISNGDEIEFEANAGEIYIVKTLNHIVKVMM